MNANYRNFALWVIIFLLVLALVTLFQSPGQKAPTSEITFSQLLSDADAGNVRDVTIAGPRHFRPHEGRALLPDLCSERSEPGRRPSTRRT